jgi:hypothetical protein
MHNFARSPVTLHRAPLNHKTEHTFNRFTPRPGLTCRGIPRSGVEIGHWCLECGFTVKGL